MREIRVCSHQPSAWQVVRALKKGQQLPSLLLLFSVFTLTHSRLDITPGIWQSWGEDSP